MSAYDYSDRAKPASAHTKAVNARLAHELGLEGDAPAWRELELAREGLVRAAEDLVIRDGDGHVIWDLDAFRFLQSPVPDERVNPSLWMSGRANLIAGLFEVVPEKIYQVRGFDLANLTLVRSQTGWIVLDCTTNVETARAAMAFASETLGEDIPARVRAVIISHSHLDHYGGLRGRDGSGAGWGRRCRSTSPRGTMWRSCASTSTRAPPCPGARSFRSGAAASTAARSISSQPASA